MARYNAGMGLEQQSEIDEWLRGGGYVVASSERAARTLTEAYHQARRKEGLTAWELPKIQDWKSFIRRAWDERCGDGRLVLNTAQEQSLWASIAAASGQAATLLEGPRYRLAAMAMQAHELLCNYAPRWLRESTRNGWQNDTGAFSEWLSAFDTACGAGALLSPARLALEVIALLKEENAVRPPLRLAGFDRILPVQRELFNAWGDWRETTPIESANAIYFYETPDPHTELHACAQWCAEKLKTNPQARLLIVTQDASTRRGEIERALLRFVETDGATPLYEFSLGIPLSQVAFAKAAYALLRWLTGELAENEVDWLLSTHYGLSDEEAAALQARMRLLRRRGQERVQWTLNAFCERGEFAPAWVARMEAAQRQLRELKKRTLLPMEWVEAVPELLKAVGFPGARALTSAEYQAQMRWQQALDSCASLGFRGKPMQWQEFLSTLGRALNETLFSPESREAPIQIAGPAESAGLQADAIWFLCADENAWPAGGTMHPLLPPEVQRDAAMPHATAQLDWDLAASITNRLMCSADEIHFSFAMQSNGIEARPSRLIVELIGFPKKLPAEWVALQTSSPRTVLFEDASAVPFTGGKVEGGSGVLTHQSQCAFKAFSMARLGARGWEAAEAGLSAAQRGKLLHAVMHAVWSGAPDGIQSHEELVAIGNLEAFVTGHVQNTLRSELPPNVRETMPRRYLELEEKRLCSVVTEWLLYEKGRLPFFVAGTEVPRTITLAGLTFELRLDRIDRLSDDSSLVIDYKTGDVSPSVWDAPRPEDVQLPLYVNFALNEESEWVSGLVFAKLRAGDIAFSGRVTDLETILFPERNKTNNKVQENLTPEMLSAWRNEIEQLADDFMAGRAAVDPRKAPETCTYCGLQTLCRIHENTLMAEEELEDE